MSVQVPEADTVPAPPAQRRVGRRTRLPSRFGLDIWIPATVLLLILFACFIWPLVASVPSPTSGELQDSFKPVLSPHHPLGTDTIGRDVLSRILHGGQVSIEVGVGTNAIGLIVGGFIGMVAGFKAGWTDAVISRVLDVVIAFPALILSIVVATYLGPSERNVIFAISFFSIPAYARLARAATLKLREEIYVTAARLVGQRDARILVRHVAPNVLPQLLTYGLLHVGIVIVIEATLSFLGAGVPPPQASWGNMISQGQQYLSTNPALVLVPSIALFITVMSVNVLGDALRARWGRP